MGCHFCSFHREGRTSPSPGLACRQDQLLEVEQGEARGCALQWASPKLTAFAGHSLLELSHGHLCLPWDVYCKFLSRLKLRF